MEEGASASSNRDVHFRWGLPQVGTRDKGSSNGSRLERDEQWIWRKEIGLDSIVLALPENLGTSHQYRTSPQDAEVYFLTPWNPAQALVRILGHSTLFSLRYQTFAQHMCIYSVTHQSRLYGFLLSLCLSISH